MLTPRTAGWAGKMVGFLLLTFLLQAAAVTYQSHLCTFSSDTARYICKNVSATDLELYDLPATSCDRTNCDSCVKGLQTFLIENDKLIVPKTFLERPTTRTGYNDSYVCIESFRGDIPVTPCDCSESCNGSADFCRNFQCNMDSSCHCSIQKVEYELLHITDDSTIVNPPTLNIPVCLYRLHGPRMRKRRLLEFESASFVSHNLTLLFNDPVVTVPEQGTLIARMTGNEIIVSVLQDRNVILPPEFVAFPGKITLIFISTTGKAIHGEVIIEGKTICRSSNCVFCKDFLLQTTCWPKYIAYTVYVFAFIVVTISLFLVKFAIKSVILSMQFTCGVFFIIVKIFRGVLRCSLLGGAICGQKLRQNFERINDYLEDNNPRIDARRGFGLIVLLSLLTCIQSDCTSHSIISSEIQNCKNIGNKQMCELYTTAEVTLRGIDYELCLWLQDTQKQTIFSLKLRLLSADCTFSTRREYFTFPVEMRHISQLACPQNYYCAWGTHCKADKDFEALTEESKSYPGSTNCLPSSVGSGCTIVSRMGCLFYRTYLVPDLLRSYEVRSIAGHRCGYKVSVERTENGTAEHITLKTSATTSDGIYMEVLGAYSQPQVHFGMDALVLRVGDPTEAYLTPVSATNKPVRGTIGQVQANQSYTKQFIFDLEMANCDFFETTLRCQTVTDGIKSLITTKEKALPISKDLHLLAMDKDTLASQMLSTEPIKIQMHFKNYKIFIENNDICPTISDSDVKTKGCYSCQILSELRFTAHSTCHRGIVRIEFQILKLYTQTVILETEPRELVIQFLADKKCYDEKMCMVSRNMKSCKLITFCLNEPSINLLRLNTSYTRTYLHDISPGSGFFSFISLPTLNGMFFSLKMVGVFLLIICLGITIFSTCVTCCRK